MGLNSSNRKNSNFGSNKRPLVGKEKGKGEKVNWIANCTRSGCVGCGGEDGSSNHLGRSGELLVLVIGDEALPMCYWPHCDGREERVAAGCSRRNIWGWRRSRKINQEKKECFEDPKRLF